MPKTLLLSGFDVRLAELPEDARVVLPARPLPALESFPQAISRALEGPLVGPPLTERVKPNARVTIALDDFTLPVPPVLKDPRREMLDGVLKALVAAGVRPERISVLVATGLSRQWRKSELVELLGEPNVTAYPVSSHDAESSSQLQRVGELPEGPVELNKALLDADLVIHLSVVNLPLGAGLSQLVAGTAGYRTARFLYAPKSFEAENPIARGSPLHRMHQQLAAQLTAKADVVQLCTVLTNELWTPGVAALLHSDFGLSRPMQMWNALPASVRHRAARLLRASYRPRAVFFGPPEAIEPRALEVFLEQHEVSVSQQADVLLFGLPDQGPASVGSSQNPVLAANLALGYVANLFTARPLLKQGGVLIFANPLTPTFDQRAHAPHHEFYEKVLRLERDPERIHERFEPFFAGRPEFVSSYQRRFAFHGSHPLFSWYQCAPARKRAGRVIVAYGDPRACARLGFTPANDIEDALAIAREFLNQDKPKVLALELPPPFWTKVA